MAKKSIFLSGWEYNKVLCEDPFLPRVSGLPAQALWDGCAQFWMFENVFCSDESLVGDMVASEELGWATGHLFDDLRSRGFLQPINVKKYVSDKPALRTKIQENHTKLRAEFSEEIVLGLLKSGRDHGLEAIKLELLSPLFSSLSCVNNVSPNSIRNWTDENNVSCGGAGAKALQMLANPLKERSQAFRAGLTLCSRPGVGLSSHVMEAQKRVEQDIEFPMIPDLLAGKLPQEDYHDNLKASAEVYKPVSDQLEKDYWKNIGNLERLRSLAQKYLWPELHGEWLPRLEVEPSFLFEFQKLLRDALLRSKFDPHLEHLTNIAINAAAIGSGAATFGISSSAPAGALAAASVKLPLDTLHKKRRQETENLTLFYQKACS